MVGCAASQASLLARYLEYITSGLPGQISPESSISMSSSSSSSISLTSEPGTNAFIWSDLLIIGESGTSREVEAIGEEVA